MSHFDRICETLGSSDLKQKLHVVSQLDEFLGSNTLSYDEIGLLVDRLITCLNDNNFKISLEALTATHTLIKQYEDEMVAHIPTILPMIVDRLGDSKSNVRDAAFDVIKSSIEILTPTHTFEKLAPYFKDKNHRVREHLVKCLQYSLENDLAPNSLSQILNHSVIKLLEDAQPSVRDAATHCIETAYRLNGQSILILVSSHNLRPSVVNSLVERFNDIDNQLGRSAIVEKPITSAGRVRSASESSPKSEKRLNGNPKIASKPNLAVLKGVDGNKITIVKVESEKELSKEIDEIGETLRSLETDWSLRIKALQRLQGLFYGGAHHNFPNFVNMLVRIREPLGLQASDLRSAITRETCNTLTLMCERLGDGAEQLADYFVEMLLRLTIVTIQVIAESGNKCIQDILKNTRVNRAIPKLMEQALGKNGIIRSRCMEYLLLILKVSPTSHLEKYADGFESTIRSGVSDAVPEARLAARQCYWAFSSHFEIRAQKLLATMDPQTRKLIFEELQKERGDKEKEKDKERPLSAPLKKPFVKPSGVMELMGKNDKNETGESFGKTYPPTSAKYLRELQTEKQPQNIPVTIYLPTPHNLPPNTETQTQNTTQPPTLKKSLPIPKIENTKKEKEEITPIININSGPKRVLKPPPSTRKEEAAQLWNGPMRVPLQEENTQIENPYNHNNHNNNNHHNNHNSLSNSNNSNGNNNNGNNSSNINNNNGISRPLRVPTKKEDKTKDDNSEYENSSSSLTSSGGSTSRENDDLLKILSDSESSLWATRAECFNSLRTIFRSSTRKQEVSNNFPKVMKVFLDHLQDQHAKVIRAVLESTRELVVLFSNSTEPFLEKLLPLLFSKLAANKDDIRLLSSSILEAIIECYDPNVLCGVLMKVLEQRSANIKIGVLEYLIHLIPNATQYFTNSVHMKSCIAKILFNLGASNLSSGPLPPELKRAGVQCLLGMWTHYKSVFLGQVLPNLAVQNQLECKKLLSQHVPNFETEASTFSQKLGSLSVMGSSGKPVSSSNGKTDEEMEYAGDSYYHTPPIPDEIMDYTQNEKIGLPDSHSHSNSNSIISVTSINNTNTATNSNVPPPNQQYSQIHSPLTRPKKSSPIESGKAKVGYSTVNRLKKAVDINEVIEQINLPDTRKNGLHKLLKISRDGVSSLLSSNFSSVLDSLFQCFTDPQGSIRELSLLVIKELLENQGELFFDHFDSLIPQIMERFADDEKEVNQAAHEVMTVVLEVAPPTQCLSILINLIKGIDGPVLLAGVRNLAKLCYKIPAHQLQHQLPVFLPHLFRALKNDSPDIRKATVFCLVDIYLVLGDDFTPYLTSLNNGQKKLITIYINRAKNQMNSNENITTES